MKRLIAAALTALIVVTMVGCAGKKPAKEYTAAELKDAIVAARDDEMNKYVPVITNEDTEDHKMMFEFMDLPVEDIKTYAMGVSLMNVKAYAVGVFVPNEGKEEALLNAVKAYVEGMQKSFESYLADQYEITKQAVVTVQEDGTVILVMCEDSQTVYDSILKELQALQAK